jgi:hypothetical protein
MGGQLSGFRKKTESITAAKLIHETESGGLFQINVADNAATDITLPAITAGNVGITYGFSLGTANSGALRIVTSTKDDTTGDVFVGSLLNMTSAASGTGAAGVMAVVPGGDDNAIVLDEDLAQATVQVGSYIECTAFSYSADGHSKWMVNGYIINDTATSTGAALFADRD